ncbi:MAG: hypothetical protein GXY83_39185 [Rhodopirellula sp.]|nr:hypothetical protein [Rhodopirellula sp.]
MELGPGPGLTEKVNDNTADLASLTASLVAQARRSLEGDHAQIIRDEQRLEQQFVGTVLAGKSLPEAIHVLLAERETLVPGASPDRPGHWSSDDLEGHARRLLADRVDAINRRLLTQASVAALSIVATCVIGMCVVYTVHTPREVDGAAVSAPLLLPGNQAPEIAVGSPAFPPLSPETLEPLESPVPVGAAAQGQNSGSSQTPASLPNQIRTVPIPQPQETIPMNPQPTEKTDLPISGNGRHKGSGFKARPLAADHPEDEIMRRGSCNAAMTHIDERAFDDASLRVMRLIREDLESRTAKPVDLDELAPRSLARRASASLLAHPEIAEAGAQALDRRTSILRELLSERPSKLKRELAEKVRQDVERTVAPCIGQLRQQAETSPYGLEPILSEAIAVLDAITYPDPDTKAYVRFRNAVHAKSQIENDPSAVPARTRERAIAAFAKHATEDFDLCLEAVAQQVVNEAIRAAIEKVRPTVEELATVTAALRTAQENVVRCLEQERTRGHRRHAVSESSNLLRLDGPTEEDLFVCLMERLDCENRRQLASRLLEKLTDRLNDLAKTRYPFIAVPAGPTTLFSRISPGDIAQMVRELLRETIGDAGSVYAAVHAYGVPQAVEELYGRAAPLCRLRGRDRAIFNVETASKMVARLPQPLGAEDQLTYQALRDAFHKLPNCECVDAPAGDREIVVVRTVVGWPIAIDSNHETLLAYYATAEDVRHRPHLFGVVPESRTGLPIERLKKLFAAMTAS